MKSAIRQNTAEQSQPRRRAIVLILVMIVIVMVSLAGFSFVATMSGENKAVHVRGEQLQMEYAIDSAEEFLKQHLGRPKSPLMTSSESRSTRSSITSSMDDESLMRGVVVIDDGSPNGRVRFTVMAPRYDQSETSKWSYGLGRESARLDLRSVMEWEAQRPGSGRLALMQLPGMTESIADALLDWMDADHTARSSGAEDDFYATLNPPYAPRNGIPESLEELLLVKGVSRSLLFGDDADQNHRLEWSERSSSRTRNERQSLGEIDWPWAELLTLNNSERNLTRDGKPRINLNDPDLAQLHAKIKTAFDAKLATFVVLYRQYGPMISNAGSNPSAPGSANRPAVNSANPALAKGPTAGTGTTVDIATVPANFTAPAKFVFRSPIDLIQSQVQIPPTAGKTGVVTSPVSSERDRSNQIIADLCDRLTTTNDAVLRGRININLAPKEVLRTIPGIDPALADQIVAARTTPGGPNRNHENDPLWLSTDGLVNLNKMKDLFPYLTTGGDVYRAQIVAFSEASRLSQRVEVVLDATRKPVRRVVRKDLQVLGRGFPWDVLDTPAGIAYTPSGVSDATPVSN